MSKTTIPTGGITADAIDGTKIADDAISEEHLDATAITGSTELAATPADTDEILISDAGTLKRLDFSHIKGGLVKLSTVSTNNSNATNFTFDEVFSSTYDQYKIIGFISPTGANAVGRFKFRTGGASGTDYSSSEYVWTHFGHRVDSSHNTGSDIGGYASEGYGAISSHSIKETTNGTFQAIDMNIFDPRRNLMSRQTWHGTVNYQNNTSNRHFVGTFGGRMNSSVDATGIKFYFSTGDINYGVITIFGVIK
mgnify:CR=1|tara:strand:+ start:980 stop:1735 length:756 start_codon:yes stop_codon:yes gene_type:complete